MIADSFDDGVDARIADAEAFAGHAADVGFTRRGAIKRYVTDDNVFCGVEGGAGVRIDDDLAAGETLAEIIVRVAFESEAHAARHERAEALAR